MGWADSPAWRPRLDRAREAVETLTRDMRAAEQRVVEGPPPPSATPPPAKKSKKRRRRRKGA